MDLTAVDRLAVQDRARDASSKRVMTITLLLLFAGAFSASVFVFDTFLQKPSALLFIVCILMVVLGILFRSLMIMYL